MVKINITLILEKKHLVSLENELRGAFDVIDYKVLPDTERLYKEDKAFKKLLALVKNAQRERDIYINEYNK